MDQMQAVASDVPHIIQVFQPAVTNAKMQNPQIIHISHPSLQTSNKITYEQTITTESLHIPVSDHIQSQQIQSQIVMSCPQTLQRMSTMQPQVLQSTEMSQPLQFTSHVILPQVSMFKQHVLVDGQQYYSQFEAFIKDQSCIVAKVEPGMQPSNQEVPIEFVNSEKANQNETPASTKKKKSRSQVPNPTAWACNVRKSKHQRGEAYVSRRGKFVPERRVRNTKNCLTSCKFKCNERINDTDREHIFKAFYSLNANEKKHFLLNTTERNIIRQSKLGNVSHRRKHSFKYFFLVRAVRYTVCKNFYLGTLAISQKPVYNVHLGKSEMNIPKPDGRGLSETSTHALSSEVKDRVRKHIMSFKTMNSKPIVPFSRKKQYLESSLSVKQMYTMYFSECSKDNVESVKESMYRKIFKLEFNLHFQKIKSEQQLCCKCKEPIKKK